jgi:hypothetical protein
MELDSWIKNPKLLDSVAEDLQRDHAPRFVESRAYLRLYWDRQAGSSGRDTNWTRRARDIALYNSFKKQTANLTREVIDAAAAVVCREMRAEVLPMGADFKLQQGCKQASYLIEGVADNSDFLSVATRAFRDGATADIGPVKGFVDPETNQIRIQRINPLDLTWVDDGTDNPRTFIESTAVSRDYLMDRYPKYRQQIKDAPPWYPNSVPGVDLPGKRDSNTVKVNDAWCAAVGESKGRHCIALGGMPDVIFEDDPWDHDITPVFSFKWQDDFRGYGGVSLARIVAPFDIANKRIDQMIAAALAGAVPMMIHQEDEDEPVISDIEYQRIPYKTFKPEIIVPKVVSGDLIAQKTENRSRAFAEGGVNQYMAQGNSPSRIESGAAQREFVDIANTRLMLAQKQWERFYVHFARVVVMLAQQARKMHVKVQGVSYYKAMTFPTLRKDSYKVNFGLASGLGLTHSGKMKDLQELSALMPNILDEAQVARSLKMPDYRDASERANAPRDLIMSQIARALDDGIFSMPSAMQDLEALVLLGSQEYQRAQMQGTYPPGNVECLRRLIKAAQAKMPKPAAPVAPAAPTPIPVTVVPGAAPPGAPPAPAAPPVAA